MPKMENVVSHWSTLIQDFHTSSQDFYESVKQAVERRKVPGVDFSSVQHHEGAGASAKREYLRVERKGSVFDICAAPFGTGFFFSSWLVRGRNLWLVWLAIVFAVGTFMAWTAEDLETEQRMGANAGLLVLLVLVHLLFRPRLTYYRIDTMLMFQKTVHGAVLEVIDSLTSTQGLRALSEDERKPVMPEFLRR